MKRKIIPELLDSDAGTPREVEGSLADLRFFNRVFGGTRTMRKLLGTVVQERNLSSLDWLDVAGASGDVALAASRTLLANGVDARALVLDRSPLHLTHELPAVCGDALALPFRDNSFDVVACSLFIHHLAPGDVHRFAREALRVARHAFVINDLVRHPVHLSLVYAGLPLYRSRVTRHDAPASVRSAYTMEEMEQMLSGAGAVSVRMEMFYLFRMGVIAWKPQLTT
ncbi:MAG TPA: methyltransferase domain-containing protein [Candidatus Angelobacter sp.]|nr:methyltransferase domain-containing protein [Candidatus Angelobacter sp.]